MNIEMKKNSSCSRALAWLVVHQIAELQLTISFQKSANKLYNQASIFPPDSLVPSADTLSSCCSGEAPISI